MNIGFWILQGLAAVLFLFAGAMKLAKTKEELQTQMTWVEDFSQGQIRLIGVAEILGSLGLVLPGLLNVFPALSAWAAVGLTLLMIGATITHGRRKEQFQSIPPLLITALVAFGRIFVVPL